MSHVDHVDFCVSKTISLLLRLSDPCGCNFKSTFYVYMHEVMKMLHFQAIPFADKFIFEDGKHNLHLKYKDQFNALVTDFLAD